MSERRPRGRPRKDKPAKKRGGRERPGTRGPVSDAAMMAAAARLARTEVRAEADLTEVAGLRELRRQIDGGALKPIELLAVVKGLGENRTLADSLLGTPEQATAAGEAPAPKVGA